MKIKTFIGTCLFLLAAVLAAAAPAFQVSFVDGKAYIGQGSAWKPLSIGDPLSTESTLRLEAGASVEIKGAGASIYLMQKGDYSLKTLLAARQKQGGAGAAVASKLSNLLNAPISTQSVVGGVRGADESHSDDSAWVETGAQDGIAQAKDLIAAEKYAEAIDKLKVAQGEAVDEELPELGYYLALAYSLAGDAPKAARLLADIKPTDGAPWRADFTLLQAKLYLDGYAYPQAVELLKAPKNDLSTDAQRASLYYFLLGSGYRGLGDLDNEKKSFSRLLAIAGDSDLAKAASRLLQNP